MATVRDLTIRWGFKVNDKPLKDLNAEIKRTSLSIAALGASAAASAASIFGIAKFTADAGDEALKASQKLGISVESYQKLGFAAKLANLDVHQFTTELNFLNRSVANGLQGNKESLDAFRALGVQLRDASGNALPVDKVFRQISANFNKLPNQALKASVTMRLFGRSGANLIPLLQKGNAELDEAAEKAERYGIVLSEAEAQAGEEFNDTFTEVTAVLSGLRNVLGRELIPVLTDLMREFIAFVDLNRGDIVDSLRSVVEVLSDFTATMFKAFRQIFISTKGLVKLFGGFNNIAKVLGIILGIMGGGALLSSIGGVTVAVLGLAQAFTLANAAALLIPIAIGALVVGLGLLIEDIVAFFQGRESFVGFLLEGLKGAFSGILTFFETVYNRVMGIFQAIGAMVSAVLDPVVNAITKISSLASGLASGALSKIGGLLGFGSAEPSASAQAASNTNNSATVNAPISITTGSNLSPQQQIGAVQGGLSEGLAPLMRGAARTFSPVEAY